MAELRFELGGGAHLREIRAEDVDELFAVSHANADHLRPWMPWAADLRRESTAAYVDEALAQRDARNGRQFVFVVDGVIAGGAGFHQIDRRNAATSVGYWIAARHQGSGLVTAAVRALVDHAFSAWDLHRVELATRPDNVRSRAVAERLGFTEEGVRRDGERFGDGFSDLVVYSLLASD